MTSIPAATLPDRTDIAIVGGGMVGLSLALLLARAAPDLEILVVDALSPPDSDHSTRPSFDARATALSHSSRVLFEQVGAWVDIAPGLASIRHIQVSDRGKPGLVRLDAQDQGLAALGYVVENHLLGQALYRRLQGDSGVKLVAPARVDRLEPVADGMVLQSGASRCRAELAVIAGGGGTDLLGQLGIHSRVRDYHQCALVANVALAEPHGDVAYERFTERGPIALLPLPTVENRHRAALVWTLPNSEAGRLLQAGEREFLDELHHWFGFRAGHITACGERHSYPLSLAVADEQVRRHLVIAGNAAHYLHPVAGQGFNLALRDMGRLAQDIAAGVGAGQSPGELAVLERYRQAQAGDQRNTILFSDSLPRLFARREAIPVALRNAGLIATDLLPWARQSFGALGTGLAGRAADLGGGG